LSFREWSVLVLLCLFRIRMLKLLPSASAPFFFSSQLSRVEMLKGYDGAEKGAMYWSDTVSIILGSPHKIADHLS
jgi:hypothetical protein